MLSFEGFVLDPRRRLLFGVDGTPIPLAGRAFDTLIYLVEHPGELIHKQVLMKAVWPGVIVDENNLSQTISTLRRALGEIPGQHRFIVTVPGRGFRFVPPVGSGNSDPDASVAVLPFANLTGDPSKAYFCDGIAEALIHALARVVGLKVPARTSSFAYQGRSVDAREIGRELGVATVLEGSVRAAGERLRVTAQLVNARTGFHLWSQSYDRAFRDVFILEDEITGEIVETLKRTMNVQVPSAEAQIPPTGDPEAYRLYLQGRVAAMPAALALFTRAIALDPQFARAYAASAQVRLNMASFGHLGADTLPEAEREARHALALEPQLCEAAAALGTISAWRGDWMDAAAAFRAAIRLGPEDSRPTSFHAIYVLNTTGHLQETLEQIHHGYRHNPTSVGIIATLATTYTLLGNTTEAVRYADLVVSLGSAEHPLVQFVQVWAAIRNGEYGKAAEIEMKTRWSGLHSNVGRDTIRHVFDALAGRARSDEAARELRTLLEQADAAEPLAQRKEDGIFLAVLLGDLDLAFDSANRWLDHFARFGTLGTAWGVLWMPELRPLRLDPRFQALAERLKLFKYWKHFGAPDNCEVVSGQLLCR